MEEFTDWFFDLVWLESYPFLQRLVYPFVFFVLGYFALKKSGFFRRIKTPRALHFLLPHKETDGNWLIIGFGFIFLGIVSFFW